MQFIRSFIDHNLHRDALHNFHVIAGSILRRQEAETCSGSGGDAFNVAFVFSAAIGIHGDNSFLPWAHILKLILFIIGGYPDIVQRDQSQERLASDRRLRSIFEIRRGL